MVGEGDSVYWLSVYLFTRDVLPEPLSPNITTLVIRWFFLLTVSCGSSSFFDGFPNICLNYLKCQNMKLSIIEMDRLLMKENVTNSWCFIRSQLFYITAEVNNHPFQVIPPILQALLPRFVVSFILICLLRSSLLRCYHCAFARTWSPLLLTRFPSN